MWSLETCQGVSMILPSDLGINPRKPGFELDLEIINMLTSDPVCLRSNKNAANRERTSYFMI